MIVLLCTLEPYRISWLPQFVRHYRDLGVDRFMLTLQLEPRVEQEARDRDFARFLETLASLGIEEGYRWDHEYNAPATIRQQRNIVDENVGESDWVLWTVKWDATLLDRLRYRVRPEWRAQFPWWVESQRLLDYFAANSSRFNPADLSPIALPGRQFITLA